MAEVIMTADELLKVMREDRVIPHGRCVRYEWQWTIDEGRTPVGRAVKTLTKRGLVDCMYFAGNSAAANLTEKGRQA